MLRVQRHEGFSLKNGSPKDNEDGMVITDQLFAVLDGATARNGLDGKLASETLRNVLASKRSDESLLQVVERANRQLAEEVVKNFENQLNKLPDDVVERYKQELEKKASVGKKLTTEDKITCIDPSYSTATCGAIIQIHPEKEMAEIVQVGDCMVAIQQRNGQVEVLTQDHVAGSDFFSYVDFQMGLSEELNRLSPSERLPLYSRFYALSPQDQKDIHNRVRGAIKPTLDVGRKNANNPESRHSYPVFNGTPLNLEDHYQQTSLKNVKRILLLSDGLLISQPTISFDMQKAWQLTAEMAFKRGLKELLGVVQWQTKVDPYSVIFQDRLKPDDDKTALMIDLESTKDRSGPLLRPPSWQDVGKQSFWVRADEPPTR